MSNWIKRRSRKTGTYTRSTTTTRSDGSVTNSRSTRVGNLPRITESQGPDGPKYYSTEYSDLGQRKKRIYPAGRTKPRKSMSSKRRGKTKVSFRGLMTVMLVIVAIGIILSLFS